MAGVEIKEQRTRTVTEDVTVGRRCDLCGAAAQSFLRGMDREKDARWFAGHPSGDHGSYGFSDVEISYEYGTRYPDSGEQTKEAIDCCPTCWREKVRPALEALGATFRTEKRDW